MSFDVAPDAYDRFMGRYSVPLAPRFADLAEVAAGPRVRELCREKLPAPPFVATVLAWAARGVV